VIHKEFVEVGDKLLARVKFTLPKSLWADAIYLVGDFNHWNRASHPLLRDRDGGWHITIDLEVGRIYQFRYLRDGLEWMNDNQSDAYVANPYGSDNSVVVTDPDFRPYLDGTER
jgi:1,4-alpha-glucan branching enzyme